MLKKMWKAVKYRWFPYIFAYTAKYTMRILLKTCRVNVSGLHNVIETAESHPCIIMLWHNRLVVVSELFIKFFTKLTFAALISKSRDGAPLAILAHSYRQGRAIRVAHNARHCALSQVITTLKNKQDVVLITPDGPRGPRYSVKPGIITAARQSNAKIVPFSWSCNKQWKLNTWDRMRIPKPFSTIDLEFGPPISLAEYPESHDADAAVLYEALRCVEVNKS